MATIVNTPAQSVPQSTDSSSAMNLVLGILAIVVVGFLLFYFGLPMMRSVSRGGGGAPQQINNNAPPQAPQGNNPQINVPDKINVDVNTPKQ